MAECPDCRGDGTFTALVRTTRGCQRELIRCGRCKGSGQIDSQQEEWIRIGGTHRTWRVAQHESIGECARRLGITGAELSDMEHGRADPTMLIADTPEVLRDG